MHTCTRKTIQRFIELFKLEIIIIIIIWGNYILFNCFVFNTASTGKAGVFLDTEHSLLSFVNN